MQCRVIVQRRTASRAIREMRMVGWVHRRWLWLQKGVDVDVDAGSGVDVGSGDGALEVLMGVLTLERGEPAKVVEWAMVEVLWSG